MKLKSIVAMAAVVVASLGGSSVLAQDKKAANPIVEFNFGKKGTVTIELFAKEAPKTVEHLVNLINKKFYDGIIVHRVEPGFVVQAGDPKTKTGGVNAPGVGSGGSGTNIPFETNKLTHEPGTMAMALSAPRSATGDSQWFINLNGNHSLDGDYCVFGKVTKGFKEVVMKIERGDTIVSAKLVTATPKKKK